MRAVSIKNGGPGMGGARVYALVFGLLLVTAGAVEWSLLRSRYRATMAYWDARQSSVADERAQRISDWLRERQANAEIFSILPSVRAALQAHYDPGRLPSRPAGGLLDLTAALDIMAKQHNYAGVYVLDRDLQVVAQSGSSTALSPALAEACRIAGRTKAVQIDLLGGAPDRTLIGLTMPVFPGPGTAGAGRLPGQPLGVTLLVLDAAQTLFPLLTREGVPTRTAETVLMRREGNDIVFFSPLRQVPAGSPNLRFPLPTAPLPARDAVEGRETSLESTDYRGVLVLTATRRIALTGWGLVRKIDREEALADFYRTAWTEGAAAALLLLAFAGLLTAHRRHVMTRALRQEEAKFRSLLESAPDAMVIVDRNSGIVLVNAQTEKMFGYDRQGLVGKPVDILVPEWARAKHRKGCQRFFSEPAAQAMGAGIEMRGLRHDGTEFPLEARLSPIETEEGVVVSCGIRDITERKQAEEALRKSEEHFRSLFENMLNGFAYCQMVFENGQPRDFIYLDVNDAFETLTGLKDVVGKKVSEVIPGLRESNPELFDIYGRVALSGEPERFETYVGAMKMWFSVAVYCPKREHFVAVFDAITERKQAEEALRESEGRLQFALDTSQMGEWELNLVDRSARRSLRHDRIFGYETLLPEWTYEKFMEHVVPEDRESVDGKFRQAMEAQGEWNFECRIVRCDRAVRWIWARGRPRRDANGTLRWLGGTVQDITERKRAEEAIRRLNEELERRVIERTAELTAANKELEAFTYSVSHDLRAPLRHIDGFSRLLLDEYSVELPEEAQRYLTRVREGTLRMGQLVDDLLNLTRVGRQELRVQLTGLNSLLEEVRTGLQAETEGREIEWKIAPLPFVECDPALMKQVLANLLANATKFTGPRTPAVIEVGTLAGDGGTTVFVRDNGVGFSMKYADKLFGVFQRLHRAEDFPGTGVGLATVRRIIHKHGGRIWAEAELNKGATFYFTLGVLEGRGTENQSADGGVECAKTK